ncbi:MAG: hypothetical protein MZW92_54990 [Comamonadaceae bacterium]|nr:hypothetical protein [Comamonadaceae bacterium]
MTIADAPSFDTDQLPGVASGFGSGVSDIGSLDVAAIGQTIWNNEEGGTKSIFIGQSGGVYDTAPTLAVTSFGGDNNLAPEEPTRQGGYYAASITISAILPVFVPLPRQRPAQRM